MVAYYENEAAVIAALKRAKTPQAVIKIAQDLEQRMAPVSYTHLDVYKRQAFALFIAAAKIGICSVDTK